jgi:hypothetical protein
LVHRLVIRADRRSTYLLPWSGVADLTGSGVQLREGTDLRAAAVDPAHLPLQADELLLARDVVDTQVVDLDGQRLTRVSDVLLLRRADGREEVAAVDVGIGAVLRRAGLGRLAGWASPVAVDWQDLHLTSSRGHLVQLSTDTAGFRTLDPRGLAELLTRLSAAKAADVIRTVEPSRAAEAVRHSHPETGRHLMHALDPEDARRVVEAASAAHAERLAELRRYGHPVRRRRFRRTAGWRVHRRTPRPPAARSER